MDDLPDGDLIRRIAHDTAADSVPVGLTHEPDFAQWCVVVEEIADDYERQLKNHQ